MGGAFRDGRASRLYSIRRIPMTLAALALSLALGQDWIQHKGDARRSGDVPDRALALPLGLVAALPMSDGLYASPAVADGTVYAVDGSGRVSAFDVATLQVKWTAALDG